MTSLQQVSHFFYRFCDRSTDFLSLEKVDDGLIRFKGTKLRQLPEMFAEITGTVKHLPESMIDWTTFKSYTSKTCDKSWINLILLFEGNTELVRKQALEFFLSEKTLQDSSQRLLQEYQKHVPFTPFNKTLFPVKSENSNPSQKRNSGFAPIIRYPLGAKNPWEQLHFARLKVGRDVKAEMDSKFTSLPAALLSSTKEVSYPALPDIPYSETEKSNWNAGRSVPRSQFMSNESAVATKLDLDLKAAKNSLIEKFGDQAFLQKCNSDLTPRRKVTAFKTFFLPQKNDNGTGPSEIQKSRSKSMGISQDKNSRLIPFVSYLPRSKMAGKYQELSTGLPVLGSSLPCFEHRKISRSASCRSSRGLKLHFKPSKCGVLDKRFSLAC
jgi:hypothetical protein